MLLSLGVNICLGIITKVASTNCTVRCQNLFFLKTYIQTSLQPSNGPLAELDGTYGEKVRTATAEIRKFIRDRKRDVRPGAVETVRQQQEHFACEKTGHSVRA